MREKVTFGLIQCRIFFLNTMKHERSLSHQQEIHA